MWRAHALLAAVVLLVYANAFGLGLAFDGVLLAARDSRTHGASLHNVVEILRTPYWWPDPEDLLYRPFTTLSFLANFAAFGNGVRPFAYHATNIALHLLNTWLVFALARRVLGAMGPAFFAAALWAAHPIACDAVANIAGRADLLASACLLAGLVLYLNWGKDRAAPLRLVALFLLALLAASSKESGAILLPLMALADLTPTLRSAAGRWRLAAYGVVAIAIATYLAMRIRVLDAAPAVVPAVIHNPLHAASFLAARWTALKILALDAALLLWPAHLASDRSFHQIPPAGWPDPAAWAGLAILSAIVVLLLRRSRAMSFWCAGFFVLALLPASNLIVLIGAPMAERFLYLPAVAFTIALSAGVWRLGTRPAAVALSIVVALFAGRAFVRNFDWNSNRTLMAHDVRVVPGSYRVHQMLGEELFAAGRGNLPDTIREFEAAWQIVSPLPPDQSVSGVPAGLAVYYDLAAANAGRNTPEARALYDKSLELFRRAVEIARAQERAYDQAQVRAGKPLPPRRPNQRLFLFLGAHYLESGQHSQAIAAFREGLQADPTASPLYDATVRTWLAAGDPEMAARAQLEWALALDMTPTVIDGVAANYARLPGGACAVTELARGPALNFDCPRLRADLCPALSSVTATFIRARRSDRATELRDRFARYACASMDPITKE